MRLSLKIFTSCILFAVLVGAFSAFSFASESDVTEHDVLSKYAFEEQSNFIATRCFLPIIPDPSKSSGEDLSDSHPSPFNALGRIDASTCTEVFSFYTSSATVRIWVNKDHCFVVIKVDNTGPSAGYELTVPIELSEPKVMTFFSLYSRSAYGSGSPLGGSVVIGGEYYDLESPTENLISGQLTSTDLYVSDYITGTSFSPEDVDAYRLRADQSLEGLDSYLTSYYSTHSLAQSYFDSSDAFSSYFLATVNPDTGDSGLSLGLQDFAIFVSGIVSSWGSVIISIVDKANWILILPVFAYIFVVASSSLRAFYKG